MRLPRRVPAALAATSIALLTGGWLLAGTASAQTSSSAGTASGMPTIYNAAGFKDTKTGDTKPGCTSDTMPPGQGAAADTRLNTPTGVGTDLLGNMYFAETGCNRIRMVTSATTGDIKTVAGNGTYGYNGDNQKATSAELAAPMGVAIDKSGDMFIADTGNNRIREVSPTGVITTLAGNGSCSVLCLPTAVSVDNGNVYVTDTLHDRVVSISVATGTITTIYSSNQGFPEGVAVDPNTHKIYVSDTFRNQIVVLTPAGSASVYAGTGMAGFADGPAASAIFNHPTGVTVDQVSNVYVSDTGNDRIRLIANTTAGLAVSTYGGTGVIGYTGDNGPATSAELHLPLAITSAQSLVQAWGVKGQNCNMTNMKGVSANATQDFCVAALPTGVATSTGPGGLFLSDTFNNHVRAITPGAPPVIPETTLSMLLPLSAVLVLSGAYVVARRRRHPRVQVRI